MKTSTDTAADAREFFERIRARVQAAGEMGVYAQAHRPKPEQCSALISDSPNARRCTADGFQGWHFCREHLESTTGSASYVEEIAEQSPIRANQ